ncbi:MAG: sigma 54-interacting transcriptional regulator [Ignavibacteriales bacterium]|nr:sigma 54-interacting transcriptional regulator [Ignavibacteriales bacterium]
MKPALFTGAIKSKPGRFEIAEDGTSFLDEIGDLSLAVQTKLLRVIESREFERVGSNKQLTLGERE